MSEEERKNQIAELSKNLKEGERLVGPTRRPDGTLRKPYRIRAGYTPQDEVAIYQPRPALLKKEMSSAGPPGYEPEVDSKPKTKSVKRNERKKEKRLQAALEKEKNEEGGDGSEDNGNQESVQLLTSQLNDLAVTSNSVQVEDSAPPNQNVVDDSAQPNQNVNKKIRALKKKIRLTEALEQKSGEQELKSEQLEKLAKLEEWRRELKQLEDVKAETTGS